MRRGLWLLPVVLVLAISGVALFRARPAAELGRPAPSFDLPSLDDRDRRIGLEDLAGTPAVLNFWASWCEPCRDEAPELARVAQRFTDVRFLGINILDGRAEALRYVERYGIAYESVRDARGIVAKRYNVTGAPETVFLDARGDIVGKYIGAFERGQLAAIVHELRALGPGQTLEITGRGETRPVP